MREVQFALLARTFRKIWERSEEARWDGRRAAHDARVPIGLSVQAGMTVDAGLPGFTHVAVCHRSTRELIETLIPVLGDCLGMNESVLGAYSDRIRWSDTRRWHPHPVRRLRAIQERVDAEERQGAAQLRFVGECAFPAGPPSWWWSGGSSTARGAVAT